MNFAEFLLKFYILFATEKMVENNVENSPLCSTGFSGTSETLSRVETTEKVRPYTIYVEGNVGCGKSTFLELFEGDERIQIVQEPVAEWQNVSGTSIPLHLTPVIPNRGHARCRELMPWVPPIRTIPLSV